MILLRTQPSALYLFCVLISFAVFSCDSRQRGEDRTAGSDDHPPIESGAQATSEDVAPPLDPDPEATADKPPEPTALQRYIDDIDGQGPLMVGIETTEGVIECELFADEAPITVANFVGLARGLKAFVDPRSGDLVSGTPFYDGVEFHRVIPNFFIQTGDRSGHGHGGPGYTIPDEFSQSLRHDSEGILTMGNQGEPDSGGSQFLILEKPVPHLDDHHTVFGQCRSLDVIRAISHVPTRDLNRPIDPAPHIKSMTFSRQE